MVICGDLIITKVQCFFIFIWTTVIVMALKNGEAQINSKNIANQNCICYNALRQKVIISPCGQRMNPSTVCQYS